MKNRMRWLFAVLAAFSLLAAACGDDGDAETSDDPPQVENGGDGDGVSVADLTLGAPQDCETNPFCIPGLQRVYDVDLSGNFEPLEPGVVFTSLDEGAIDIGLLFSTDGRIADKGWVLLEDDKGMLAADNITPVATDDLVEAYGDDFTSLVDGISAAITTDGLTALNKRFDVDKEDADAVATAFLTDEGLLPEAGDVGDGPTIKLGAQDFGESAILAQIYGQALAAAGYPVEYVDVGGFRDLLVGAFEGGDVNFSAEYAASMLEFLNGNAGEATGDADETVGLLQTQLDEIGLTAMAPAPAVDTNAFVVTAETSERLGLTKLSQLTN